MCMVGGILSTLRVINTFNPHNNLMKNLTNAQEGLVTSPRPHSYQVAEFGFESEQM